MKKANRLITVLIFVFLYIPMAVLIVASFNTGKDIAHFDGFTLNRYVELFQDDHLLQLVHEYIGSIPEAFYDMDMYLYEDRPLTAADMEAQIAAYIPARLAALDEILEVDDQ